MSKLLSYLFTIFVEARWSTFAARSFAIKTNESAWNSLIFKASIAGRMAPLSSSLKVVEGKKVFDVIYRCQRGSRLQTSSHHRVAGIARTKRGHRLVNVGKRVTGVFPAEDAVVEGVPVFVQPCRFDYFLFNEPRPKGLSYVTAGYRDEPSICCLDTDL